MVKHIWRMPLLRTVLAALIFILPGCEESKAPFSHLATVTYMPVQPQSLTLTTELSGRTAAFTVADIRPQVNGIIKERLFVEGSDVREGDVLYQIDPSLYQAAYDNAKAALARAEANVKAARFLAERYAKVVRSNAISRQDYDNAVAAYDQAAADVEAAKAALNTAAINLGYTKISSPVSGRIGRSTVTQGALVTQNQAAALATVQGINPIYVDVTRSSAEILRLRRAFASGKLRRSGMDAYVTLKLEDGTWYTREAIQADGGSGGFAAGDAPGSEEQKKKPVEGSLKFSEITVEESTGSVTIRAVFPNDEGVLLPGMYVRAVLEEGVNEQAFLAPQKAVIRNSKGLPVAQVLVRTEQEGVFNVEPRVLTVDRSVGNDWLVTDGLRAGDLLLIEGIMKVRAGVPVRGVPAQDHGQGEDNAQGSAAGNTVAATGNPQ